jgi:uncharacterized protein involved in exopolysaccharide biosynthesis/MinD-like ATPase involved in chromosome partitioning or flagellar assembly
MTSSTQPEHFEPSDYLGLVRRRWWIVFVLAFVGVALAGAYVKVAPKTFIASALVQVNALPNSVGPAGARTNSPVNMDNEAQLVQSVAVASLAGRDLHSPLSAKDLAKQISVTVPPNTTFLGINCAAPHRNAAALCANAFASAYLRYRNSLAVGQLNHDISTLQSKITGLQNDIARYKTQLTNLPVNSPTRTTSELRVTEDTAAISSALTFANQEQATLANLSQPNNTAAGTIATPASPPAKPSSPRKLLLVPSGLVTGLILGLLLALFVDRRDRRIRDARDVERFLGTPVLLDGTAATREIPEPLVSARSKIGRQFSELAQYLAVSLGDGNHVLVVVGTAAGDVSTLVAANLAADLARTRSDTILVCASRLGAIAPEQLGLSAGPGLADALAGRAPFEAVARPSGRAARLRVVLPGAAGADNLPLEPEECRRLVARMRSEARFVIIAAQAFGEETDGFVVSEFSDATVIVVETARTQRSDAQECVRLLARLHSAVLGAVVLPPLVLKPATDGRPTKRHVRSRREDLTGVPEGPRQEVISAARMTDPANRPAGG